LFAPNTNNHIFQSIQPLVQPPFFCERLAWEERKLKVAETVLIETADDRYANNVMELTEKRDVRVYWAVKKYEKLLTAVVDELISHKEFQRLADMADRAVKREFNKEEVGNRGQH